MSRFLISRVAGSIMVLFIVSVLAFGLQALTPGDPARLLLQASGLEPISPQDVAAKRLEMGLDDPLLQRYLSWLFKAVQGDFGYSFRSYKPVTELYLERLPTTLVLAVLTALITILVAIPLGILAAYKRGKWPDVIAQLIAVIGAALPNFWVALVFIFVFAATLKWLPAFGSLTPQGMIMPAIVLALPNIAVLTRLTRSAVLDVLGQDYVTIARAKGLKSNLIALRHVLPNALIPVVTVFGLEIAYLLTGAAIIEYIFALPGIGKMAVDAALAGDVPVLVGFTVIAGLVYAVVTLITDLIIAALDPRLRRA
jgi:ABC-type dipeptide/oligopeptide/nickel transport system permease component